MAPSSLTAALSRHVYLSLLLLLLSSLLSSCAAPACSAFVVSGVSKLNDRGRSECPRACPRTVMAPLMASGTGARREAMLEEWARANGIFCMLNIKRMADGERKAVAANALAGGERVVRVPREVSFVTFQGDASPLPPSFVDQDTWQQLDEHWNAKLALMLLHEMRRGVHWTDEELAELQNPRLVAAASDSKRSHAGLTIEASEWRYFDRMQAAGEQETSMLDQETFQRDLHRLLCDRMTAPPSLAELRWAMDCAQSRSFGVSTTEGVKCFCLCPLADMLNHDPSSPALFDFDPATSCFAIRTSRAWSEGEEVTISYGELSNEDLLQFYGFVLDDNMHEFESFDVEELGLLVPRKLIGSEADRLDRLFLLSSLSSAGLPVLSPDHSRLLRLSRRGISPPLMAVARVLSLSRETLAAHEGRLEELAGRLLRGKHVCLDNELEAWRLLRRACERRLEAMPTTEEEDVRRLEETKRAKGSEQMKLSLRYRMSRKRFLRRSMMMLDGYISNSERMGMVCTVLLPPSLDDFVFDVSSHDLNPPARDLPHLSDARRAAWTASLGDKAAAGGSSSFVSLVSHVLFDANEQRGNSSCQMAEEAKEEPEGKSGRSSFESRMEGRKEQRRLRMSRSSLTEGTEAMKEMSENFSLIVDVSNSRTGEGEAEGEAEAEDVSFETLLQAVKDSRKG
ncbi:hypothetical protein GUITHDRAFT_147375 [Guillardia theta CCMP2712]|uniref:SET domain-containing protein n=1 Tax=Guillardia theta (strain CCMP2712) TaxID=905079 RepID=L1ID60_GUITC|nr:hypothetical protein GUITHDRAFT_147375 [Guillardia theta CCMP2712]EKX34191.1 hypothetical protein GUITHDRAFT_147375 [Guillardia theta CCMP2712]|eukprot:XP_005821171.1 hypothetical protein GUITHDRAFT_147375 [Guillardia theta CCMP2712]